jgi:hypothetical protein
VCLRGVTISIWRRQPSRTAAATTTTAIPPRGAIRRPVWAARRRATIVRRDIRARLARDRKRPRTNCVSLFSAAGRGLDRSRGTRFRSWARRLVAGPARRTTATPDYPRRQLMNTTAVRFAMLPARARREQFSLFIGRPVDSFFNLLATSPLESGRARKMESAINTRKPRMCVFKCVSCGLIGCRSR